MLGGILKLLLRKNPELIKHLYRGSTLKPIKSLISEAGKDWKKQPGSWHTASKNVAGNFAIRPSKSYQDPDTGKAWLMGFNPDNPGVIRRVPVNKTTKKLKDLGWQSDLQGGVFPFTYHYNLPEEKAAEGVISLLPTLMHRYKHPIFEGGSIRNIGVDGMYQWIKPNKREMFKTLMAILKSGEKWKLFNRGGIV